MIQTNQKPAAVIPERELDPELEKGRLLKDRKLGHEWADWNGRVCMNTAYLKETPQLILQVLAIATLIFAWLPTAVIGGTALVFSNLLGSIVPGAVFAGLLIALALVPTAMLIELALSWKTGRSLYPFSRLRRNMCRVTVWLYPIVERFGITRDRLGASAITLCNALTLNEGVKKFSKRILILAPRCLANYHKREIREMADERGLDIHIAPTGRSAREKVIEVRPTAIIAIACQRDLVSGVRDIHEKIAVLSIELKMPAGPCKDTFIALGDLQRAFDSFAS